MEPILTPARVLTTCLVFAKVYSDIDISWFWVFLPLVLEWLNND